MKRREVVICLESVGTGVERGARGVAMTARTPVAPRETRDVSVHGDPRSDDYFWLRDRDDPRTLAYLQAENAYADAWLAPHAELKEKLYQEMLSRIQQDDDSVPMRKGDWWYSTRTRRGEQYPHYLRRRAVGPDRRYDPAGVDETLLDLNELARGQPFLRLGLTAVTRDAKRLAYTTDPPAAATTRSTSRTSSPAPSIPGRSTRGRVGGVGERRPHALLRDDGRRPSAPIACGATPSVPPARTSCCTRRPTSCSTSASARRSTSATCFSAARARTRPSGESPTPTSAPTAPFRCTVFARRADVEYDLEHRAGRFYVRINDTGRNFRLVTVDAEAPDLATAEELIAARARVMLDDVDVFAGHLAVTERVAGSLQLRIVDLPRGADHAIAFDEPAYSVHTAANAEFETATLRFVYTSLTTPASTWDYDLATRERVLRKRQPVPGYEPSLYASERVFAVAADGTEVPVSLVYRKDARRDGPQPLLLYGYGSYGIPIDAAFSQSRVSLLDRGVVFAIAHIRGGGDLGRSWYEAGKMAKKQTTFDDFIACAEKLVAARPDDAGAARHRGRQRRRPAHGRGRQPAPGAVPRGRRARCPSSTS